MPDLEPVGQKKVLVVEGRDENFFFCALLKHMGITGVDIKEVGGKEQFKNKMPALVKQSGFSDVEMLAVVRDADENAHGAFKSVKDILERHDLQPPEQPNQFSGGSPAVGVFIMPGSSDRGTLEDLCLKTARDHPAMECVDTFSDCIRTLEEPPHNMAKAKVQAFLAAMPKIANHAGIGAQKGYWNFDSEEMTDLRSFMERLR